MKISPPAGHDGLATQRLQQSGAPSGSASFARMLADRPSPERAAGRAFGFGEFGLLGLHPLGDHPPAPVTAPHHGASDAAEPATRMTDAKPAPNAPSANVVAEGAARPVMLAEQAAGPRIGSEQDRPLPVPLPAVNAEKIATFPDEKTLPRVERTGGGADPQRHSRTTPWFSISLDEAANRLQISAALHDLDKPDRDRLLRRLNDVAAEFGVELAEFRLDGQPVPPHRIQQRS